MLRVGLIGLGYFAQFHRQAWQRIDSVMLAATCDADPSKAADHTDVAALLASGPFDILDIAGPPPMHAATIRAALPFAPRVIICQKPFCTSIEEAEAITAEAEAAGIPIIIHENFRFQPWFRAMKAALDDGKIGTPMNLTFRMRTGDGQGPDAYLARQPYFQTMPRLLIHETGVHYIDTFRFLLGDPEGIYADLRRLNPAIRGEDAGHLIFDYANGARAVYDGNRLLDFDTDNTRRTFGEALLEGDGGAMTLAGDGKVTLRAFGTREAEVLLRAQNWPGFAGDCVFALQLNVVGALAGHHPFENEARDYLDVMRLTELAYASNASKSRLPFRKRFDA